jgi:hypothetical protein
LDTLEFAGREPNCHPFASCAISGSRLYNTETINPSF